MITRLLAATGVAAALMVSAAGAMTISNHDNAAHKVVFTPKYGHAQRYAVAAHNHRSINCKSGGTLTLGKLSHGCDAKTARITIKAGKFAM